MLKIFFLSLIVACSLFYFIPSQETKIHLVWQIDPVDSYWERDWVKEVLSEVDYEEIYDGNFETLNNHSIIVVSSSMDLKKCKKYFKALSDLKYKFGIVLLSDENYSVNSGFFNDAKFLFRNYWHKKFVSKKKVLTFPLGYKAGFWKGSSPEEIKGASERGYVWSFAGQTDKSTRVSMVENMRMIAPFFLHETHQWNDPGSLSAQAYRDILLKSVFVPCPRGWWNLDSFRVYEALECGCIPIVEKSPLDYFSKFFVSHPFISVTSWDEAPQVIEELMGDPVRLEAYRSDCHRWWQNYKTHLKKDVRKRIYKSFFWGVG